MLKIEKVFYPVCVRVKKEMSAACRNAAYGKDIHIVLDTEMEDKDYTIICFVFETDMSRRLFLCNGYTESYFPVALKITGNVEEVRNKIVEIGKKKKITSAGIPLKNESGILVLTVFETAEAAAAITNE